MASRAILSLVRDDDGFSPHYLVRLAAKLSTTGSDYPVTVRELWREGAVIESEQLPRSGKDVFLRRGIFEAFGAVTLSHSGRCVVEFEDGIDEAELMLWLHAPGETARPRLTPHFDATAGHYSEQAGWNLLASRGYHLRKGAPGD